ncbi:hypothetical protein BSKO_09537 [Bryopsis sp. KO-2023]|nr:hypothetical protein BSKO_09537 [Bryopsis sp. KO-2023]
MDDAEQGVEVRRDAYGEPLKVYIDSDTEGEESGNEEEQENDAGAAARRIEKGVPSFKFMRWGSQVQRGAAGKQQHVTKGLLDWTDKVMERRCPGYGVRRDLKNWSDRVLKGVEGNEEHFDLDLIDADQIDLGDEGTKTASSATGLGAEMKAYWMRTVEDEVEKRSAVMRDKWEEDMKFELEELKELREQNKLLTKELSDQRSEMDALTLRLHIIKTKQTKTDVEKKEDYNKKAKKGKTVSTSGMAAREMLSDEKGDVDAQHKLNQTIDDLRRKNRALENKIEEVCKNMDAANRRVEQLEQQIQYMTQQNEEEVQELHRRIEEEGSAHDCRVQELEQKLKEAKKSGPRLAEIEKREEKPVKTAAQKPRVKHDRQKTSSSANVPDSLQLDPPVPDPCFEDDADDTPRETAGVALIDPVPFRLDGAKTIVKIIRSVIQQALGEEKQADATRQKQQPTSSAPSIGNVLMAAISAHVHQVMQDKDVGDDLFTPTKEQGSARMMAALELLTLVSSIERECADRLADLGEVSSSSVVPGAAETKHAQDIGKPPKASSRAATGPSRPDNKSATAVDRQPTPESPYEASSSESDAERLHATGYPSTSEAEADKRSIRRERPQHAGEGRFQQQTLYDIDHESENLGRQGRAQRRVGWLGLEESEIGDFPVDPLTGSQASSPGELSDSGRPQFFSIRSYLGKHKKRGDVSPINTSILSRPLSAPPRVVHMERESDKWHRRNVRRLKRSRVITSTPQKGICLEPSCRRRKAARRKKSAKLEKFRIETEIHPMRGHTSAIKGYRLQKISKSMREEMDAKIETKTHELREVLKQVQMAYFKSTQELAQSQAQQRELVEAVQDSRGLWLRAQDEKVLLQQEVQDLRRRLHQMSIPAA